MFQEEEEKPIRSPHNTLHPTLMVVVAIRLRHRSPTHRLKFLEMVISIDNREEEYSQKIDILFSKFKL
jgi:hypothetical protein